jgi:magnesium transporter
VEREPLTSSWERAAQRARKVLPLLGLERSRADSAPATNEHPRDEPRRRDLDEVIGDCGHYVDGRRRPGRVPLERAGRLARSTTGFVWIGLQQPDEEQITAVAKQFDLPPLAVEDALKAHQRPKLDVYGDVVFAVLKPVRYVDHDEVVDVTEIAVFIGPTFVVTVRHGESDVLRRVRAELDAGTGQASPHGPSWVLYRAADLVVDGYEEAITHIDGDVDEIESEVFASDETEGHSQRIYKLKREIAEFRRAVVPLTVALERLAEGNVPGIDEASAPYFRDVHDHALRAADAIEGHDRRPAERDLGPPERGHAQDLGLGCHRARPDRHRGHLRHELPPHARAGLALWLLRRARCHRRTLHAALPAVPAQWLALGHRPYCVRARRTPPLRAGGSRCRP